MNDDGLKAPAGYEIERWPDGSPKLVNTNKGICPWMDLDGQVHSSDTYSLHTVMGFYRIALRKLPERKLLNFREAVAAANRGKDIYLDGNLAFAANEDLCLSFILNTLDRTDFYAEDAK